MRQTNFFMRHQKTIFQAAALFVVALMNSGIQNAII